MNKKEITENEVVIKTSNCPKCSGIVRASVEHQMTNKSKKEFMNEVMQYNLSVSSISLDEYRNHSKWCSC